MNRDISYQLYEEVQRIAGIGGWELDLENEQLIWSPMVKEIHGVPPDYEPDLETAIEFYKKGEHRETITHAVREAVEHGTPFDVELIIITAKGEEKWIRATGQCEFRDNKCIRVYGVTRDIHEQRINRMQLELNELRFRALVQHGADLTSVLNADAIFLYVSPSSSQILGIAPEEFIGKNALDFIHPDDAHRITSLVQDPPDEKRFKIEPYRVRNGDGKWRWLQTNVTNMIDEPSIGGYVINSRDVTSARHLSELEKLERSILENYERGRLTLDELVHEYLKGIERLHPDMICMIMKEEDDKLFHWSSLRLPPSFLATINMGIDIGPNQGASGTAAYRKQPVYTPDITQSPLWDKVKEVPLSADLNSCWSHPVLGTDGKVMATLTVFHKVPGEPGQFEVRTVERTVNLLQILLDNHFKEKAYMEALNERVNLLERISDGFFAVDRSWTVNYWNSAAEEMFRMPRVKIVGKNLWEQFGDTVPEHVFSEYHRALEKQVTVHIVEKYSPLDKWIEATAFPSESGLSVYLKDVTDRKLSEEQMIENLREKETLLAEIHHRVKNNLAVVSAMMQLQADQESAERISQTLSSSVGRIRAMANIHEHLYRSDSFSKLDFSTSIDRLVNEILNSYHSPSHISYICRSDQLKLNINQAVPCSLITNEVVTNAIKHAFTPKQAKKILTVELAEHPSKDEFTPGQVVLRIQDNGRGLPDNVLQQQSGSLGMRLIDLLSQQLKGSYTYQSTDKGAQFELRFPKIDTPSSGSSGNLIN